MTGNAALDYADATLGRMVTAHLGEAARARQPICRRIITRLNGHPYEYIHLVLLPLSADGRVMTMLLVGLHPMTVPPQAARSTSIWRCWTVEPSAPRPQNLRKLAKLIPMPQPTAAG